MGTGVNLALIADHALTLATLLQKVGGEFLIVTVRLIENDELGLPVGRRLGRHGHQFDTVTTDPFQSELVIARPDADFLGNSWVVLEYVAKLSIRITRHFAWASQIPHDIAGRPELKHLERVILSNNRPAATRWLWHNDLADIVVIHRCHDFGGPRRFIQRPSNLCPVILAEFAELHRILKRR